MIHAIIVKMKKKKELGKIRVEDMIKFLIKGGNRRFKSIKDYDRQKYKRIEND